MVASRLPRRILDMTAVAIGIDRDARRTRFLGPRVAAVLALGTGLALGGAFIVARPPTDSAESSTTARAIRRVRVLIASDVPRVRLRADGPLSIEDADGVSLGTATWEEWAVVSATPSGDVRLGDDRSVACVAVLQPGRAAAVTVSVERDGQWTPGFPYAGTLRLIANDTGRLDVINGVDVERYVACVVANEVWPTFETEAYRAQAIVSRTYALYQMIRRNDAPYDVLATQHSQVYRGIRSDEPGRRATDAASDTHGIVLTWHDGQRTHLFSTYYSAACGGMSQSAAIFGREDDIPPLSGGVRCDYCRDAPRGTYRWGPVRLTATEVYERLTAAYPEIVRLGGVSDIAAIERRPDGRTVRVRIIGSSGESHDMLAERFRLALGGSEIRSTHFDVRVTGQDVVFENGRGFGHGLGLCQWGMQGQAVLGKRAGAILRYYYPGARLTRVY